MSLLITFIMWPLEYAEPRTGIHYTPTGQRCLRGLW